MPVKRNIFIFGDSISYGEWDEQGGWAQRLRHKLDRPLLPQPDKFTITYNLGIPSDTSEGVLTRLEDETQARLNPNPAEKEIQFIIAIGTNDSRWLIEPQQAATATAQFSENLKLISQKAEQFTNNITFLGLLPCIEAEVEKAAKRHHWEERYTNQRLSRYNELIKQHCQDHQFRFIDVHQAFTARAYQDLFADGLHPNSQGHELICEMVFKAVS